MNDLKAFYFLNDTVPHKPYCTDELGVTYIRTKKIAIKKKYLQINQPTQTYYMIFDVDRNHAVSAWEDCGLPPPTWSCVNPKNGHAHLVYRLVSPVCTSEMAHIKPLKYFAAIESALIARLGADRSYAGLLTKNPLHASWKTAYFTDHTYSLDELAEYADLKGHPLRGKEASGLGRNCELFDTLRFWAYKAIRDYWSPDYKDNWFYAVEERARAHNCIFNIPLSDSEIRTIARSIAKWTYKYFSPSEFRESQARKGAKGGQAGSKEDKTKAGILGGTKSKGGGRKSKKAELLPLVLKMKEQGYTQQDIADDLEVTRQTIINWLK